MNITTDQLHAMIPLATDKNIAKFLVPLNNAMFEFNINTPLRIASFIAQISHESGSLHYVEEIADGSAYEYRKDLGNLRPEALAIAHSNHSTTGKWYKGHGLIQITGYDNHLACGIALQIDCVNNPKLLTESINSARSAAWFWKTHNCNTLADMGMFDKISRVVNGGTTGQESRRANYKLCCNVLGVS